MAGTTIAYGEITILDLLDTATYIYYADNAEGDYPSATSEGKTYIGIYGGPALSSRPSVPDPSWGSDVWSGWQKYVGEDGTDGVDGNGINSITYYYLTNNSSDMPSASDFTSTNMEIPTSTNKFLWQKEVIEYTNGTSQTTVSLLGVYGDKGEDGADGILYNIETNHEKIYKFFDSTPNAIACSPEKITFKAYKIENGENTLLNPVSDYNIDIMIINNNNNIILNDENYVLTNNDKNTFKHLISFLKQLKVKDNTGAVVTLFKKVCEIDAETSSITFKLVTLLESVLTLEDGNTQDNIHYFEVLVNLLKQGNVYFVYKIFNFNDQNVNQPNEKDLLAIKPIPFEFGTNEDMAKFALTASSINAAVQNTKLEFNIEGLKIIEGGLKIVNSSDESLLEYDKDNQVLKIIGGGTFTGTIHAEKGSFTGDVIAETLQSNAGHIGGFLIEDGGLYSEDNITYRYFNTEDIEPLKDKHYYYLDDNNEYVLFSNENFEPEVTYYERNVFSSIRLIGKTGQIDAENINLGTGAHINKYIQLGDARLWNPMDDDANGMLLDAGAIRLSQTGNLQLGNIVLDGERSRIFGTSFSITPDQATFNNVNVSGKISTVVFEKNHVQSVGGSMIFKPSYLVESYENIGANVQLILDNEFDGAIGDNILLVSKEGSAQKYNILNVNSNIVTISGLNVTSKPASLIDLGQVGDMIIGINSNTSSNDYIKGRGLTIAEIIEGNNIVSNSPQVFIGDLNSVGYPGYGLYSENVYLTGSLTTKVSTGSGSAFAGVNTLNGANATKFTIEETGTISDTSKIVFWAGSASTANKDIQASPFQVTEHGSLYAAQGIFEGAIISKSEIKGADIYAARIHGQLDGAANSLTFYDASKGIVFKKGDWDGIGVDSSTEVFSIGEKGLQRGKDSYFIHINEKGNVKFIGDEIQASEYFTDKMKSYFLHLKDNKIYSSKMEENGQEQFYANIVLGSEEISFGLGEDIKELIIDSDEIQLKKETVKMDKTVLFGEQLKYEQVSNGYNLYVL